jgi:hypothetical protein
LFQKERRGKIIRWFNIGWQCSPCGTKSVQVATGKAVTVSHIYQWRQ